ncbi:MAG: thiamine-phosphate kinase [Flaviflexus sp.]|nr:thiamine-phosphate kinase [Flaviflexus sp.]
MNSEEDLLDRIGRILPDSSALVPSGDDAAVIVPAGAVACSTDILVENVHFRTDWSTGEDVGWRCVMQNVADAVAMGARPVSLVVALTLPAGRENWAEDFARGLAEGASWVARTCGPFAIDGGDLSAGPALIACGTVLGDLEGRAPILRSGARPGDELVHVGHLGASASGLADLQAGVSSSYTELFRRPLPPLKRGLDIRPHAMMDVSDGLVRDARRMAAASSVSIDLHAEAIAAAGTGASLADALTGGEDHGFLAAVRPGTAPDGWRVLGKVGSGEGVTLDGQPIAGGGGWDHFEAKARP